MCIDELGIYETRATNGNTRIGGIGFDNILFDYCVEELKKDCFKVLEEDIGVIKSLYQQCQIAKEALSTVENTTVTVEQGSDCYKVPLSRKMYEGLIADQVNQTIECVKLTIEDAKIEDQDIDEIILIGGSTLTPLIRSCLVANFGDKLNTSVKPFEAGILFTRLFTLELYFFLEYTEHF